MPDIDIDHYSPVWDLLTILSILSVREASRVLSREEWVGDKLGRYLERQLL